MPELWRSLFGLIVVFGPLSLFSIGGGASLLAEIEHQSVTVHHWTTHREFADLFAISRAAPGPGTMLSTLIGWKVAGWAGAVTATVALYLPSSLLVFGVSRVWGRWRGSLWHSAIERGLAPIAAGLMLAGGLAVLQAAGGAAVWGAAAVATGVLLRWPQLNPLILFGVSGALFVIVAALAG